MKYFLLLMLPALSHCASLSALFSSCDSHPAPLDSSLWPESLQALQQLRLSPLDQRSCSTTGHCTQTVQTIASLSRDAQGMRLRALSPLGPQWLQVDWRNGQLQTQTSPGVPEQLQALALVADAQLVHWPLDTLQQAFMGTRWQVQQTGNLRELSCNGQLISRVEYPAPGNSGAATILSNLLAGYRLEIFALKSE